MPRIAFPSSFLLVALGAGWGCGPSIPEEAAREAVKSAFADANPPGRTGLELGGRAVWLRTDAFEDACLEQKDLAFNDNVADRPARYKDRKRISPTYQNQRYITAATDTGWCVYLGSDPTLSIDEANWARDHWILTVSYGMEEPTPWFECLARHVTHRTVNVRSEEDESVVEGDLALTEGDCPHPLPGGEERTPRARPTADAPRAPSRSTVLALFRAFDEALYQKEWEKALDMVSCYNLYEERKYGSCSVAELISVGPLTRGSPRPEDGPPWLENVVFSVEDFGAIRRDRRDGSLYHVRLDSERGGSRTVAVQWVDGRWKLVGVVGRKAEALTFMRFVYDLDRREKRDIFERRMEGEPIDEKGHPLDPYADLEEE